MVDIHLCIFGIRKQPFNMLFKDVHLLNGYGICGLTKSNKLVNSLNYPTGVVSLFPKYLHQWVGSQVLTTLSFDPSPTFSICMIAYKHCFIYKHICKLNKF